jgi:hypothetical protein
MIQRLALSPSSGVDVTSCHVHMLAAILRSRRRRRRYEY